MYMPRDLLARGANRPLEVYRCRSSLRLGARRFTRTDQSRWSVVRTVSTLAAREVFKIHVHNA